MPAGPVRSPSAFADLPEIIGLSAPGHVIRIAPETDVPVTPRVMRLVDTPQLRRLGRISQLGLVGLVYPGAMHTRLEHSLGVYHRGLQFVQKLAHEPRFSQSVDRRQLEAFLVATLVHDCGHWPFCHPIEDMQLETIPKHEGRARAALDAAPIADALRDDWQCTVDDIMRLLNGKPHDAGEAMLCSLLSGPIDVDKLDYLQRDSMHAGVPYGRNFDARRLVSSLTIHPEQNRLAITEKGRTAAEMMVFARYVMFSEVYWHHTARAATAMLQRAVWLLQNRIELPQLLDRDDSGWTTAVCRAADGTIAEPLLAGLFGPTRRLYKRAAEFDVLSNDVLHHRLSRRPYAWLVACSRHLADLLSPLAGRQLSDADVLIDAPPVKLEVDINIDVVGRDGTPRRLGDVSPVVHALANQQFDDHVKRVRIFLPAELRDRLPGRQLDSDLLRQAIEATEATQSESAR